MVFYDRQKEKGEMRGFYFTTKSKLLVHKYFLLGSFEFHSNM